MLSEGDWLDQIKQKLQTSTRSNQIEKVSLHLDRDIFNSPDTIWLKAYVTNPQGNALFQSPTALHINLISEDNITRIKKRFNVNRGVASGAIILPDSLKKGQYLLQAYTDGQGEIGQQTFEKRVIYINTYPGKAQSTSDLSKRPAADLLFFPEGGRLINGFESKIAFKILRENGYEKEIEGVILDEAGKIITNFKSDIYGVGSFALRPEVNESYKAQIQTSAGNQVFQLPGVQPGYTIKVLPGPGLTRVLVKGSGEVNSPLALFLQRNGQLLSSDTIRLNQNGLREKSYLTQTWPEGIVKASLFNNLQAIESERLFFQPALQTTRAEVSSLKPQYGRREPVSVNIQVKDENGNPLEVSLSASVSRAEDKFSHSLRNNLQFTAALENSVPDPESYFNNVTALDNLLLTQKSGSGPISENLDQPNTTATLSAGGGRIQGIAMLDSVTLKNAVIYLMDPKNGRTELVTTNPQGIFFLPASNTNRYFYQVWQNGVFQKSAILKVQQPEIILTDPNWKQPFIPDSAAVRKLKLKQHINTYYTVKVNSPTGTRRRAEDWPKYPADKYYPLEEYNEMHTMEEVFREMIPSVRIVKRKGQTVANMYNVERRDFYRQAPLYIIDGKPTWNSDLFLRLDATQLRQVNIYYSSKNLEPFGFMGSQGVIAVFSKNGNYQDPDLNTEYILNVPEQQVDLDFKPRPYPANLPDFRSTVYWNPDLKTNKEGKAAFIFNTTDEPGDLIVEVEGITKEGKIISQKLLVPVQPGD